MNVLTTFVANLELGSYVFFPLVVTLIVMMSLFAYDEIGGKPGDALEVDKK